MNAVSERLYERLEQTVITIDDASELLFRFVVAGTAALREDCGANQFRISTVKSLDELRSETSLCSKTLPTRLCGDEVVKAAIVTDIAVQPSHDAIETWPEIVERTESPSCGPEAMAADVHARERRCSEQFTKSRRATMNELGTELDWHARGTVVNGPDTSTDAIAGFQDGHVDSFVVQSARRGESRSTRANHDNVSFLWHLASESSAPEVPSERAAESRT